MTQTPESQQDLCIKWHSYLGNLGSAFPKLLADQRFLDVTLSCEGQQLRCHKVVLAASSPYLEALLNENPCKHPIIVLPRDIKMWEVQALIDFMYKGEVNVSHAGLAGFVKCAELLQVKGLSSSDDELFDSPCKQTTARRSSTDSASSSPRSQEETTEKDTEKTIEPQRPCTKSTSDLMPINNSKDEQHPRVATGTQKLELIEENCDDEAIEGENGAERIVEILCDLPNDTHYANVTQTSIYEHVQELAPDHFRQPDVGTNNSGYSDLNFDYIEEDDCRESFNETVSELIMDNQGTEGNFSRLDMRNRPISEEKSDSDGGTSGYSSLQILDVRSLAKDDTQALQTSSDFPWQPDEANSEDNKSGDIRVMLSTSLTRAIKRNVMNNRSYAIFRKTVKRHSSFGSRKRKSTGSRSTSRSEVFLSPSAVVLQPPKQGQVREYDAKAMYTALMEVKNGDGISEASTRHKIPRTTLCNWIKRLNIKVANGNSRQKYPDSKKK